MIWLRRGAIALGIVLALPLVLAGLLLGAVQLPPVQSWLVGQVERLRAAQSGHSWW